MDILYTVKRSLRRKKLTITVERDRSIVIHVPDKTTDEKIKEVIDSKRQWIYEKIGHSQKLAPKPHAPGKELVNGESLYYLGKQYQVEIAENLDKDIAFDQKFQFPSQAQSKNIELLRKWYMKRARETIISRGQKYAIDLGVIAKEIKIVDNRYRWGSCTVNNNINISWRLIKAPMFVIDYVIVHELTHLVEPNHTPEFWNIVRSQLPRMEQAKQWLKENGQLIQGEL